MKEKVEYNGRNVLGTFMNAPIFVGNFSIVTDFTVVENMDAYRDEGMREVIVGEPFCKASYVEARRFDGIITIFNGNDSVTYQMFLLHCSGRTIDTAYSNPLNMAYQPFKTNTSYSVQQIHTTYSNSLDTSYRSSDTADVLIVKDKLKKE
ncbi:hypothetical protein Tco_0401202 [Tanacetum coccineum]